MNPSRKEISKMRRAIRKSNNGEPDCVFAQIQREGQWKAVKEIEVIHGTIWVKLRVEAGKYLAWDIRLVMDASVAQKENCPPISPATP